MLKHLWKHHPSCYISTFYFLLSVNWIRRKHLDWKCGWFVMWERSWRHRAATTRERCLHFWIVRASPPAGNNIQQDFILSKAINSGEMYLWQRHATRSWSTDTALNISSNQEDCFCASCSALPQHPRMPSSTNDFLTPSKCRALKDHEMKELAQLKMPQGSIDNLAALKCR